MWSLILPLRTRNLKAGSNDPRRRQSRQRPVRIVLEQLENRLTPSAIFVAEPNGSLTTLDPTDINAAFAGILRASGRSTVVTEQVRHGENDLTDHGAVIDAEFTPTGLVTLEPIPTGGFIRHPVTVQQLANYFGFDHFNWVQTVTLPNGWQSQLAPSGPQLHQPYTDPQTEVIRTTAANGAQADTTYVGDGSGYYWAENPYFGNHYWHNWLLNPSPLDSSPNSSPVSTPYWFTFEDIPFNPVAMQGTQPAYETFSTSLVGVDAKGNPVGPWSGYGTNFTWTSTTVGTNVEDFKYFRGSGIQPWINAFTNSDSSAQPTVISGGLSNIQFDMHATPQAPAITTNPKNQVVGAGSSFSLVAAAIGIPAPKVQWQVSTDGGNSFSNIPNATSTTLTLMANVGENSNEYQAIFMNSAGTATTTPATLTAATSPIVTANPTSQVVSAGNKVSLTAAAVGSPAPTVQWQMSSDGKTFTNIAGATTAIFTTTVSTSQNGYAYRAVFANSAGNAATTPAVLTVNTTPSNLVISASTGTMPQFNLINPSPGGYFGAQIVTLTNGNFVVTDAFSAAYLFNGQTGSLISALTGLGDGSTVTALPNGNYLVRSPGWDGGKGAVTWGSGTTGVSGTVSAANSLVGSTVFDEVGGVGGAGGGITVLANGNYVVDSPRWGSNGGANGLGAATWGNGATGTSGVVSAANSIVGSSVSDQVGGGGGLGGVTALTNGNYVVDSPFWNGGLGAATWGNGTTGTTGVVSAANSLVGSTAGDNVGWTDGTSNTQDGVVALTNGNYVVDSLRWNGLRGAATWGNGATGTTGVVSSANSLVGSNASDSVGSNGVIPLTNGNYVVASPNWGPNTSNAYLGAATWGNGATGISGPVSTANSLVGANPSDSIGSGGVTALTNGNYVVDSPFWGVNLSIEAGLGAIPLGAVTWENGSTAATGTVHAANSLAGSLVGSTAVPGVGNGGVTALTNGNYVVDSYTWNYNVGAVTWGNGTTGITGTISAANSLVGTFLGDQIGAGSGGGFGGVTALTNGNYVVDSPQWQKQIGAVTLGNGTTGTSGTVSAVNSLVGNMPGDQVGGTNATGGGVTALTNGNYVVLSPNTGTATWGNGMSGVQGTIASLPSLSGVIADPSVGVVYVTPLPNGSYVVTANSGQGQASDTWVNGATGTTLDGQNKINAQNSLMGVAGAVPLFGGSAFLATDAIIGLVTVAITDPSLLTYAFTQGQTITIPPSFLTRSLNAGTDVTLQANDDIIVNDPITLNPTGAAGTLTLQAGRSILINANINTANGDLALLGNDTLADGVIDGERDPGNAVIAEQSGAFISTDAITVNLMDSTDKTNNGKGTVTLPQVAVTDPALVGVAGNVSPTAGAPFTGAVATFTDPAGAEPNDGANYVASINWGDMSPVTSGTITFSGGTFTISGSHIYAATGSDTITITISHDGVLTTVQASIAVANLGQFVQTGLIKPISFWAGLQGQELVRRFGLTASGQTLGQWLATAYPNLYGGGNGAPNLSPFTNAQISSYYLSLFLVSKGTGLDAEVLATSLEVFTTTLSLGGTTGQAYGFTVNSNGLGAYSWNIGASGQAFGVTNNTVLDVYQILLAANNSAAGGEPWGSNTLFRNEAFSVFHGINGG